MLVKKKDYFSTREVAKLLNVAVSTVQSWTDDGVLQAWMTVGGHRRIAKKSVEDMLSKNKAISIVVVEDNDQERMLYEQHFNIWGMKNKVSICRNGYAGLIHIGQQRPKIIITDLMMPNMNGFEMIKSIKDVPALANTLIIVISALTENEIRIRGGLPEDTLVFKKPISFDNLETLIRKHLHVKNEGCQYDYI